MVDDLDDVVETLNSQHTRPAERVRWLEAADFIERTFGREDT